MREPPSDLDDAEVLGLVRRHWNDDVDGVEHLPVGFGAHHWRATVRGRPLLFVTYDTLHTDHHTGTSLEDAYAAAAELAFALDFVVAGLPSHALTYTVPAAAGALSVTPWVWGERPTVGPDTLDGTARMLRRLHAAHPPRMLPRWTPVAAPDLDRLLATDRHDGPFAVEVQALLRAHAPDVRRWVAEHAHLTAVASGREWVVTHGEPHLGNQLATSVRPLLVDWESVRLAPRERDLRSLIDLGAEPDGADGPDGADPEMLRLFDLDWRLDEVGQYAAWFAGPHTGGADDRVRLRGLREELERP